MSEPYLQGLANASACLNYVANVLPADAAILVTADHGGHARSHGTETEEDMRIPLILRAPGLAQGSVFEGEISILDMAPTVAGLLGLARPAEWVGRDLLVDGSAP
jgi:arylsulfatase A-like enzyme